MNWVSKLKKSVRDYLANKKKTRQNKQRTDATRKKLSAKAKSIGLTTVNARQYSTLKPEDQAEIDKMLGRKKKKSNGSK